MSGPSKVKKSRQIYVLLLGQSSFAAGEWTAVTLAPCSPQRLLLLCTRPLVSYPLSPYHLLFVNAWLITCSFDWGSVSTPWWWEERDAAVVLIRRFCAYCPDKVICFINPSLFFKCFEWNVKSSLTELCSVGSNVISWFLSTSKIPTLVFTE